MRHLEDNLRTTVEDLASSAPPLDGLAMIARIRGRRIRRRRQAVLCAAVAVLAGAVITPYAVFGHRDGRQPQPAASVPSSRPAVAVPMPSTTVTVPAIRKEWWRAPVRLPGGVVVTSVGRPGATAEDGTPAGRSDDRQHGNVALNRVTGRYQVYSAKYQRFAAAPAGRYVLIEDESAGGGGYVPVGVLNAAYGSWQLFTHGAGLGTEWSPDGEKIALTMQTGNLRIIVAKTGAEKDREIPGGSALCPDVCTFTWLPGGTEVALAQRDPAVAQSEAVPDTIKEIKVFSAATGELVRTLPVPGVPAGSGAWSPDGRYVALQPDATQPDGIRIAEVATGRVVTTLPLGAQVRFVADHQVLLVDGLDVRVFDLAGRVRATSRLPADFADREISLGVE
ncbi:hypothetical protein ACTOB_008750 [Actinoplanes oblitus]|uniref:WD40 repeat domain-containing protein n=1 Tax=Actinoplanes oblitus TaxID=3040509 RepID=A0ABY8WHK7_9ACTN|nr:hypothetical protein [Actinoplanes oblitus]WIM96541.1 hypothetical protein ACTOB_008750 [Actinoplanes oblitus]